MENKHDKETKTQELSKLNHVGGITDDAGGVDPEIDKTLMRLADGP